MLPKVVAPCGREFADSLRPLLIWIRVIGIDLNTFEARSAFGRWAHFIFGSLMIIANIGLSIHAIHLFEYGLTRKTQTRAFQWNVFTHHVIFSVRNVVIHLALFTFVKREWNRLFTAFRKLEVLIKLTNSFYRNIRWICFFGVLYVILKGIYLMIVLVDGYVSVAFIEIWNIVVDVLNLGLEMYPNSAVVLFCILGWSISVSFEAIRFEIDSATTKQMTDDVFTLQLDKWKRIHLASCQATDLLNHCFGIILLTEITFIFMDVIAGTFFLLFAFIEDNIVADAWMPLSLSFISLNLLHLLALSYIADIISIEGSSMIKSLRSLQLSMSSQSSQISQFMSEVNGSIPKIHALGFFAVGRRLIPTLLGTTLTYLVILFQFYRAEKD